MSINLQRRIAAEFIGTGYCLPPITGEIRAMRKLTGLWKTGRKCIQIIVRDSPSRFFEPATSDNAIWAWLLRLIKACWRFFPSGLLFAPAG